VNPQKAVATHFTISWYLGCFSKSESNYTIILNRGTIGYIELGLQKLPYRSLDPRTQLEQAVAADLKAALEKRGCEVTHYGTPAAPAPATSPCDISVTYGPKSKRRAIMVEVAQRVDASELESIIAHLDAWADKRGRAVDLIYSGRSTSARMARLVRNENERRVAKKLPGRIVFLKLDDLEEYLERWKGLPADEAPADALAGLFERAEECADDLSAAEVFRQSVFPDWVAKAKEISEEVALRLASQQERLKKDIQRLENKLRQRGITGPYAHKVLIYLFFMALFEDKRGKETRATKAGFLAYRENIPTADKNSKEYRDRSVHHLLNKEILADAEVKEAGIPSQYEKIQLGDDFVLKEVIPIFENYSFADAAIDAIGAVFEALARRAEKDNRIGQFFTPEVVVEATCRLAGLRPTDLVADPACGTGRFLIHAMSQMSAMAGTVAGKTKDQALRAIRRDLLLGSDIDPWIAVIAKMNMYIYGDGKSNIRRANGLTLATVPAFGPQRKGTLANKLDVVLTNPPLGDLNFGAVAEDVAKAQIEAAGTAEEQEEIDRRAAKWSKEAFAVVPHTIKEEQDRDNAAEKANEWRDRAAELKLLGDTKKEAVARKRIVEWEAKLHAATKALGAGDVHYEPAGSTAKGGRYSSVQSCIVSRRCEMHPCQLNGVAGLSASSLMMPSSTPVSMRGHASSCSATIF
jgi:type I restriction-modification system DNA methylase subunit